MAQAPRSARRFAAHRGNLSTHAPSELAAIGLPYPEGIAGTGGDLFAVKSVIDDRASARYDELLDICTRAAKLGNSSMTFEMGSFRNGERLISGEMVYVNADPETRKSRPLPEKLRKTIEAWEADNAIV